MRIIFHADDFGATENVNANILAAWQAGGLDSISIIANGEAIKEAAIAVNTDTDRPLRLVVHLNLSEGKPLVDPDAIPMLVDSSGYLKHGFLGLWMTWLRLNKKRKQDLLRQIETEWRQQIKTVIDTFTPRQVVAVDGHIHIHMLPFLFPLAIRLAREAMLTEVRISREILHFSLRESLRVGFAFNVIKFLLLNILAIPARKLGKLKGMNSPDMIAGVLYSGNMTPQTARAAINSAERARIEWLEVLFHPGRATTEEAIRWKNNEGIGKFYLDQRRDFERDALVSMGKRRR